MRTIKPDLLLLMSILGLLANGSTASATNINTQGAICAAYNAGEVAYVDQLATGVRNIKSSPLQIVCAIPRSPLAPGTSIGSFFIDGSNANGASTRCTLYACSYTGSLLGSSSFTTNAAHYDQYVALPADQLPASAYTLVYCVLPANGNGVLHGVTSVQ